MFRPMLRAKQSLDREECLLLLQTLKRGVLAVQGDDGYPYALPINHYYCPEDGKIYFHSGKKGHKIDALLQNQKVSFCVIDEGRADDGDWALHFKSVIVFGRVEFVEDCDTVYEMARRLSRKFTDDEAYIDREIERSGPGTLMFALVPEHISGKRIKES